MPLYATIADVRTALGRIGNRLPAEIDVAAFLAMGHATVLERLRAAYGPDGPPAFTGDGLEVVRWAEAKTAAAAILEILRSQLDSVGDAPDRMRRSAEADLLGGVIGYPPGGVDPDATGPLGPSAAQGPRTSSSGAYSLVPDPYGDDAPNLPFVY